MISVIAVLALIAAGYVMYVFIAVRKEGEKGKLGPRETRSVPKPSKLPSGVVPHFESVPSSPNIGKS